LSVFNVSFSNHFFPTSNITSIFNFQNLLLFNFQLLSDCKSAINDEIELNKKFVRNLVARKKPFFSTVYVSLSANT